MEARARAIFGARFGGAPTVVGRAPGRVELLGNHTDHNGGLVMAAALDRVTVVAARPADDGRARVWAEAFGASDAFDPGCFDRVEEGGSWANYVRGVVWALAGAYGPITGGFEAAVVGNVPLGGGLSSSASLEAAVAMALVRAGLVPGVSADLDDPARMELARTLQKAENGFVGVSSGLLDQFSSLFGREDHAVYLDCRSLAFDRVPLGSPATAPAIVVCDSKTSRRLADGMYNIRRAECETVVTYFQGLRGADRVKSLRDVSLDDLMEHWDRLDPVGRRRARHVLGENERVKKGVELLRNGDVAGFGTLMSQSHVSSRDDFQNSSRALDGLIEAAEAAPGYLGGKLSGAGWAGCTVNLVEADKAEAFAESVAVGYARRSGIEGSVVIGRAAPGAC
jgi:galactokinase